MKRMMVRIRIMTGEHCSMRARKVCARVPLWVMWRAGWLWLPSG